MKFELISPDQYGIDPRTIPAMDHRARNKGVSIKMNVASFAFGPRNAVNGDVSFDITLASQGVGYYVPANSAGREIRVNNSHSEHQIIYSDRFIELREDGKPENVPDWPSMCVVTYVFTERPACGGAWWGQKRLQGGCADEIATLEDVQRRKKWDLDPAELWPEGARDDLEITVLCLDLQDEETFAKPVQTAVTAYRRERGIS
jgi:hypothetical protein